MASPMLDRVSPTDLANRGQIIETTGKIVDFDRLVEAVETELRVLPAAERPQQWQQAPVDITLRYGWSESQPGIPVLEGRLKARVAAVCQRCMQPFDLSIGTELKLLLPAQDADSVTSDEFEVWEFDDDDVSPHDIVEEALIMAMPFSAMHQTDEECGALRPDAVAGDKDSVRPFANLKSLMADAGTED